MENMVWLIFGIIAFLIAIGIVIHLFVGTSEEKKITVNDNAVRDFSQWCGFVCGSDVESRLTKEIEIASGSVISTDTNSICLTFKGRTKCAKCACKVAGPELELDKPEILKMYESHRFKCVFDRTVGTTVRVECYG